MDLRWRHGLDRPLSLSERGVEAARTRKTYCRRVGHNHWTRDIQFTPDVRKMLVSVGSASNVDDPETTHGKKNRADVLEFDLDGRRCEFTPTVARSTCFSRRPYSRDGDFPKVACLWGSLCENDDWGGIHADRFLRIMYVPSLRLCELLPGGDHLPSCTGLLPGGATLKTRKDRGRTGLRAGRSGPHILHRPGGRVAQLVRRVQRPVRVAEHLAS